MGAGVDAGDVVVLHVGVAVDADKEIRLLSVGQGSAVVEIHVAVVGPGHEDGDAGLLQERGRLGGDGKVQILLLDAAVLRAVGLPAVARVQDHQGGILGLLGRRGGSDGHRAGYRVPSHLAAQRLGNGPKGHHSGSVLGYVGGRGVQGLAVHQNTDAALVGAGGGEGEQQDQA